MAVRLKTRIRAVLHRATRQGVHRMQKRKRQQPSYRQRKGYDQAIVTLTDSVTRYRKDYWLGPYGSPESRNSVAGSAARRP